MRSRVSRIQRARSWQRGSGSESRHSYRSSHRSPCARLVRPVVRIEAISDTSRAFTLRGTRSVQLTRAGIARLGRWLLEEQSRVVDSLVRPRWQSLLQVDSYGAFVEGASRPDDFL